MQATAKSTHVYNIGNVSKGYLSKACCTQADLGRAASHVEMAGHVQMEAFLACATSSPHRYSQKGSVQFPPPYKAGYEPAMYQLQMLMCE